LEEARQIARLVKSAGRYGICNGNCLQQSVVLWWLLQLKNTEAAIRFGARKQNDQLDAHAWVEYRGIVLNDDSELHGRFGLFKPVFPPRSERA